MGSEGILAHRCGQSSEYFGLLTVAAGTTAVICHLMALFFSFQTFTDIRIPSSLANGHIHMREIGMPFYLAASQSRWLPHVAICQLLSLLTEFAERRQNAATIFSEKIN